MRKWKCCLYNRCRAIRKCISWNWSSKDRRLLLTGLWMTILVCSLTVINTQTFIKLFSESQLIQTQTYDSKYGKENTALNIQSNKGITNIQADNQQQQELYLESRRMNTYSQPVHPNKINILPQPTADAAVFEEERFWKEEVIELDGDYGRTNLKPHHKPKTHKFRTKSSNHAKSTRLFRLHDRKDQTEAHDRNPSPTVKKAASSGVQVNANDTQGVLNKTSEPSIPGLKVSRQIKYGKVTHSHSNTGVPVYMQQDNGKLALKSKPEQMFPNPTTTKIQFGKPYQGTSNQSKINRGKHEYHTTKHERPKSNTLHYGSNLKGKARVNVEPLFDDPIKRMPQQTLGRPWPQPRKFKVKSHEFGVINPFTFQFYYNAQKNCDIVERAIFRYKEELHSFGHYAKKIHETRNEQFTPFLSKSYVTVDNLTVTLDHDCNGVYPHLHMDESYSIEMEGGAVKLRAAEVWGILRGLETFYQMLYIPSFDDEKLHIAMFANITDSPAYVYRGVLLDTARHFMSMQTIYTHLEAMAQNKMNTLHWHLVDDQAFSFQSQSYPSLWKQGAFALDKVYSFEDITNVIEYARDRGIRVLPEFDTPGHTRAWLGQPDLLASCGSDRMKYTGVFDVTRNSTYAFLEGFLAEVRGVFKDHSIHLGGDEVSVVCWYKNPEIMRVLEKYTHDELINQYFARLQKILESIDNSWQPIVWEEVYRKYNVKLNKTNTIIEVWLEKDTIQQALSDGFQVIYAGCWYLDHIRSEKPDWMQYYDCDPTLYINGNKHYSGRLLGGEACMWAEYVDDTTVIQRLWPRAIAPAERLWGNPSTRSYHPEVEGRYQEQLCRMKRRGIPVAPTGPGDCDGRMPFDPPRFVP